MFLKSCSANGLIEVMDMHEVVDPFVTEVHGITQQGEDTMDEGAFEKGDLVFPSGEPLPLCWRNSHYRQYTAG